MSPAIGDRVVTVEPLFGYPLQPVRLVRGEWVAPIGTEGVVAEADADEPPGSIHVVVDMPGTPYDLAVLPWVQPRQVRLIA